MSIPSCLQDTNSKVTLVREWIKQNPKPEKIDLPEPVDMPEDAKKLKWNDTPKGVTSNGGKMAMPDEDELTDAGNNGPLSRCNSTELPDIAGVSISQPVTPKRFIEYLCLLFLVILIILEKNVTNSTSLFICSYVVL